ncbi:MAG: M48 family metalloprotease [Phycisphaerales bacterium JB060]
MPSIHVLVILVGLLLGRDLAQARGMADDAPAWQFVVAIAWTAAVAGVAMVALPACARAAAYRGSWRLLQHGLGLAQKLRWLVVLPFAAWSISVDGVGAVEALIGPWVGLDEALAATPPVLALLAITWAEHPLHDRMRQAMLVRQLDRGGAVELAPTRLEATVGRARAMLAMPLVPVLLVVCWHETVEVMLGGRAPWIWRAIDIAGTIAIVCIAPAIVVRVLGTTPLRSGGFGERIDELCRDMGARVTGVRVWSHPSANAAVLGLLPWARYMLVTEPLLDGMPRHELDAVVAHELAHVRQHHVLWIVLAMLGIVMTLGLLEPIIGAAARSVCVGAGLAGFLALVIVVVVAVLAFGMVSRLIERHADARAAVVVGAHRAIDEGEDEGEDDDRVHPSGPQTMAAALDRVCALNGVDPNRWGFRHGSVRQRQRALAGLVGARADRLPVDRAVGKLRLATLLTLTAAGSLTLLGLWRGWFYV